MKSGLENIFAALHLRHELTNRQKVAKIASVLGPALTKDEIVIRPDSVLPVPRFFQRKNVK